MCVFPSLCGQVKTVSGQSERAASPRWVSKGNTKEANFLPGSLPNWTELSILIIKKITTTWGTADGGPGRAGKPSILWRRSFFTADVANRDDVILRWYERCSSRGHQCCFVYHAGAVFASRLIRLCSKEEQSISRGIQKGFLFNPHFFFSKQRNKIFTFRIIWLKFNHRWKVFQARHTKTNVRVKATLYSCKKPPLKAGTVNGCKIFL